MNSHITPLPHLFETIYWFYGGMAAINRSSDKGAGESGTEPAT